MIDTTKNNNKNIESGNNNINNNNAAAEKVKKSNKEQPPPEEEKKEPNAADNFVQIEADSNELSYDRPSQKPSRQIDQDALLRERESDRVSFSRAISLYRASASNSIQSSVKGTRWAFGHKIGNYNSNTRFIFMPLESIKVKYRVLQMVQATSYGDNFRIQIQQKTQEERKRLSA